MEVIKDPQGNLLKVALCGRLDHGTADRVEGELQECHEASAERIAVDCRQLSYVSSAGLRILLMTAKKLKKVQKEFVIFGLQPAVFEVFQMAGFDQIIKIVDDERTAFDRTA